MAATLPERCRVVVVGGGIIGVLSISVLKVPKVHLA